MRQKLGEDHPGLKGSTEAQVHRHLEEYRSTTLKANLEEQVIVSEEVEAAKAAAPLVIVVPPRVASNVGHAAPLATIGTARVTHNMVLLQEKMTMLVTSGDIIEDLLTKPDFLLLAVFLVTVFWALFRVWIQSDGETAEKYAEVRAQRDALQSTYLNSVAEVEGILQGMSESSACLAEWNFEEHRSKFIKFVEAVSHNPHAFADRQEVALAMVDPLRSFLSMWLSVFKQCTLDPMKKPKVICSDYDLRRCKTVGDLAGLVADRLNKNQVTFIREWVRKARSADHSLKKEDAKDSTWLVFYRCGFGVKKGKSMEIKTEAQKKEDSSSSLDSSEGEQEPEPYQEPAEVKQEWDATDSEEEKEVEGAETTVVAPGAYVPQYPIDVRLGLAHMSVLSQNHAILLIAGFLGLMCLVSQVLLRHVEATVFVVLMMGCLAYVLYQIADMEELTRLEMEIRRIKVLCEEVKKNHVALNLFYGRLTKLSNLWRYRTLPTLEHFQVLQQCLEAMPPADKVAFLQAIDEQWASKMEGLGAIEDWMGEDSIPEEFLKLTSNQLNQATEYISMHRGDAQGAGLVVARIEGTFGFLVVRILNCQNVKNKAPLGQTSNPYVSISVDQKNGKNMWKSKSISGDLNPRWNQEYQIPIGWAASTLELHVKDDQKNGDRNQSLGYVHVQFRDIQPGVWIKRKDNLVSERKGTKQTAELFYDIFFANEVRQLRQLDGQGPTTSSSDVMASRGLGQNRRQIS